jgi:peptidoglycan/LPS O-acetylase OafA/YrhL
VSNQRYANNSYTFLRHLLASLVLVSHVFGLSAGFGKILLGDFSIGTLAVFCFFSISGYLVIPGLLVNGIRRYVINRFTRIYPGYLLVIFFTGVVFYPIWRIQSQYEIFDWNTSIRYFLNNLALFPQSAGDVNSSWNSLSGFPFKSVLPSVVNGSIWTIPLEIGAYLFLCSIFFLAVVLKKYKFEKILITSFFIIWGISIYSAGIYPTLDVVHSSRIEQVLTKWPYLLAFMTGASMRVLNLKKISNLKFWILIILVCTGFNNLLVWALIGSIGFTILTLKAGDSDAFASFNQYRDISYGIYLYHFPIIQVLSGFEVFQSSLGLKMFYTILFTIIFAYASSIFVEVPMQNYARNQFEKKRL